MRIEIKFNKSETRLKTRQCLLNGIPRDRGNGWTITVKRTDTPCVFTSFLNYKGNKICSYSNFCEEVFLYPQNFVGISKKELMKELRFIAQMSSSRIDSLIKNKTERIERTLPELKFR